MKLLVRAAMTLVALAAAALSYQSLTHLGALCGYSTLAWLYPLVVDLGAVASCAAWLHTRGRQPLIMTWALLATSVLLNGTDHYLVSTTLKSPWWLTIGVAAVPPLVLGLCVHLAVGLGRNEGLPGDQTGLAAHSDHVADDLNVAATAARSALEQAAVADPEATPESDDLLERARRIIAESGQIVGRNRLAEALNVTPHRARQLLAELDKVASA